MRVTVTRSGGPAPTSHQVVGEDLFLGRAVMVAEALVRAVGRAGLAVGVRGRLVAAARTGPAGATDGVGSAGSLGCGLSEESTGGVGSAALDVKDAPDCPPGLACFASAIIC